MSSGCLESVCGCLGFARRFSDALTARRIYRSCVRPVRVAHRLPLAGMQFGERGLHRFRELRCSRSGTDFHVMNLKSLPHNRQSISLRGPRSPQALTGSLQGKTTSLRHPLILLSRHHRPDHARHLVGQGDHSPPFAACN